MGNSQSKSSTPEFHVEKLKLSPFCEATLQDGYKNALTLGTLLVAYGRLMLIGPCGAGKTSLLNGLMQKSLTVANSTQLVDSMAITSLPKHAKDQKNPPKLKSTSSQTQKASSDHDHFWVEQTESDEDDELAGLINYIYSDASGQYTCACPVASHSLHLLHSVLMASATLRSSDKRKSVVYEKLLEDTKDEIVSNILSKAISHAKENPGICAPQVELSMDVWDCGGNPAFLDILPAFLTPMTLFLLLFDARKSLEDTNVAVSHRNGRVVMEECQQCPTMELLQQWMTCIHATSTKKESDGTVPDFPRILPIGSHGGDEQVIDRKEKIREKLSSECDGKAFASMLLPPIIVDNTNAGTGLFEDASYQQIRKQAVDFANNSLVLPTPTNWVLFRKVIKKIAKMKPVLTLKEVNEIGAMCGIAPTRDRAIPAFVSFYHDMGIMLYYSSVPSLKEYVIINPQWLLKQFAKLLAHKGLEESPNQALWSPLWEKGILLQSLYERLFKDSPLPPQALIDLLEHFHIAAKIDKKLQVYRAYEGKKYFIPSVLPLCPESFEDSLSSNVFKKAATLHLLFNTQCVPLGFFSNLVTMLMKDPAFHIRLDRGVFRNHVTFLFGDAICQIDKITITQCTSTSCIQVEVSRIAERISFQLPFSVTCREILKHFQECSMTVLQWLPCIVVTTAFKCDQCEASSKKTVNKKGTLEKENDENSPTLEIENDEESLPPCHYIPFQSCATACTQLRCENYQIHVPNISQQYWLKESPTEESLYKSDLSDVEFARLAENIQAHSKLQDLAKTLEMTRHLNSVQLNSDGVLRLLTRWSREMHKHKLHTRSHLVKHLRCINLDSVAESVKYGEYCNEVVEETQKRANQTPYTLSTGRHPPNSSNTKPQLADLLRHVQTHLWYRLGIYLGLSVNKLKQIQQDTRSTEDALTEMFQAWLMTDVKATWNKLYDALEELQLGVLANEIKDKFLSPGSDESTQSMPHPYPRSAGMLSPSPFTLQLQATSV